MMLAARLARGIRPLSIRASGLPKPRAGSPRSLSNFPGSNRPRYVRFEDGSSSSGGSGSGGGRGNPWDMRNWDRNTKIAAGVGSFAVGYYLVQCVCARIAIGKEARVG